MPSRCLNRVMLIGNLTRDPELRYTPGGMAVISFGLATNRSWTTKQGEKKEDAQFHRIVAWNKLAELCSQLLAKGTRVYVAGRLQYREWTNQESERKQVTEIIIDDMILLTARKRDDGQFGNNVSVGGGMNQVATSQVSDDSTSGQVEDIIIPDDLGEIKEVKASSDAKDATVIKKEGKKDSEEMPF